MPTTIRGAIVKIRNRLRRARADIGYRLLDADLEPMTPADLRVISLALETHERVHIERAGSGAPAAIAARRVRDKIARNMAR